VKLKSILKDKKAVTLIELIIAITILAIIVLTIVHWISTVTRNTNKTSAEAEMKNQARQALETIVKDMRSVSAGNIEIYDSIDPNSTNQPPNQPLVFTSGGDVETGRMIKANNYWYRIFCYDAGPPSKIALYRYPYSVSNSGAIPTVNRDDYKLVEDILYDPANQKYGLQIILLKDETIDELKDNLKTYKIKLNLTRKVGADTVTQDVETTISKSVIED